MVLSTALYVKSFKSYEDWFFDRLSIHISSTRLEPCSNDFKPCTVPYIVLDLVLYWTRL